MPRSVSIRSAERSCRRDRESWWWRGPQDWPKAPARPELNSSAFHRKPHVAFKEANCGKFAKSAWAGIFA